MKHEAYRPLLRVSLELALRLEKTSRYLGEIDEQAEQVNYQVREPIANALSAIKEQIPETLRDVGRQYQDSPNESVAVLNENLAMYSKWFLQLHEMLAYLPHAPVISESLALLQTSFGEYYASIRPSIILGSLFNAAEFDFFEVVRHHLPRIDEIGLPETENIVLQLAICDQRNPSAWAILAHEMAHAIDAMEEISSSVPLELLEFTDKKGGKHEIPTAWCQEICADLIAARVLGPAPMLALLSLEYCLYPAEPIYKFSPTHPSTKWRLAAVRSFLTQLCDHDHMEPFAAEYIKAWQASLETWEVKRKQTFIVKVDNLFGLKLQDVAEWLGSKVQTLKLPEFQLSPESLSRCGSRLMKGYPIGAQGAARHYLNTEIDEYESRAFESREDQVSAFHYLASQFKESPLDPATILFSCFQRRHSLKEEAVHTLEEDASNIEVSSFCHSMEELDSVIAHSINSSALHRHIDSV